MIRLCSTGRCRVTSPSFSSPTSRKGWSCGREGEGDKPSYLSYPIQVSCLNAAELTLDSTMLRTSSTSHAYSTSKEIGSVPTTHHSHNVHLSLSLSLSLSLEKHGGEGGEVETKAPQPRRRLCPWSWPPPHSGEFWSNTALRPFHFPSNLLVEWNGVEQGRKGQGSCFHAGPQGKSALQWNLQSILDPLRKGQPHNKGHTSGIAVAHYLTSEKRTTSQQRTHIWHSIVNIREEDNLS